jgi:hypothetical protein
MALDDRLDDLSDWVSAAETYHWCNGDPLIDWLNAYGSKVGMEILNLLRQRARASLAEAA